MCAEQLALATHHVWRYHFELDVRAGSLGDAEGFRPSWGRVGNFFAIKLADERSFGNVFLLGSSLPLLFIKRPFRGSPSVSG